jgi:choice-of-anchor A domain-containing protein
LPLGEIVVSFRDFDFVAFGDFQGSQGDIEGRLAVQNNLDVVDWTVGLQLETLIRDNSLPFSLIVGHDASYNKGQIHPQGDIGDLFPGLTRENAFIGGVFTAPDYLLVRADGGQNCGTAVGCLDAWFNGANSCYQKFSDSMAQARDNAHASIIFGNGLLISCESASSVTRYTVTVDSEVFNNVRWYALDNCNLQSEWVVNIEGTGGVVFRGGSFPAVTGGVVFNVRGSGRVIEVVEIGLEGHLLAPGNDLVMNASVIIGKVVVRNAHRIVQTNRPCPSRKILKELIVVVEEDTVPQGPVQFKNNILVVGDVVEIQGQMHTVIGFSEDGGVIFAPPVESKLEAGDQGTFQMNESTDRRRIPGASADVSSAVTVQAMFALVVALIAVF